MTREQWVEEIHDYHSGLGYNYIEIMKDILKDWKSDQIDRDTTLQSCERNSNAWRRSYDECMQGIYRG